MQVKTVGPKRLNRICNLNRIGAGKKVVDAIEEKKMRRFVIPLLFSVMHLDYEGQMEAIGGAEALLYHKSAKVTEEAAKLFSRLPPNFKDADKALKLLTMHVQFIEDGTVNYPGTLEFGAVYVNGRPDPNKDRGKLLRLVS